MRGTPYGQSAGDHVAFALSHPARRFALLHAARYGCVHALDIQREFTDYNRTAARDILHVLRDRKLLRADKTIPDIQGKNKQLTYVMTPRAAKGIRELLVTVQTLEQEAQK